MTEDAGQPPYLWPDYVSTRLRAPLEPLVIVPETLSELTGPAFGDGFVATNPHSLNVCVRASRKSVESRRECPLG